MAHSLAKLLLVRTTWRPPSGTVARNPNCGLLIGWTGPVMGSPEPAIAMRCVKSVSATPVVKHHVYLLTPVRVCAGAEKDVRYAAWRFVPLLACGRRWV